MGISEDFGERLEVGYSLSSKDAVAAGSFVGSSGDFVEELEVVRDSVSSKVGFDVIEGFSLGLSVNVGLNEGLATVGGIVFDGSELVDGAMLIDGVSEGVDSANAATTGGRCTGLNEGGELAERCTAVGDAVNARGSFESPWNSFTAGCATFSSPPFPIWIQPKPPKIPTIPIAVKAAAATTALVRPTAATAVVGVAGRRRRATFSLPRRASVVDARIMMFGMKNLVW